MTKSVLLDGFHAEKFIFGGFIKFQVFVFEKWPTWLKIAVRALFNLTRTSDDAANAQ